jgi:hypothetical protein
MHFSATGPFGKQLITTTDKCHRITVKATHEDLLSEDWDTNLTICDKVQAEGEVG